MQLCSKIVKIDSDDNLISKKKVKKEPPKLKSFSRTVLTQQPSYDFFAIVFSCIILTNLDKVGQNSK